MTRMNRKKLLMAAVAGLAMGASFQGTAQAQDNADEVKCYGVNSCGAHAKCSVMADDIAAVKKLLGDKEFKNRFGKSEAHSCGAHAKCGSESKILNWTPTSGGACTSQGGILIQESNGKKTAKKA